MTTNSSSPIVALDAMQAYDALQRSYTICEDFQVASHVAGVARLVVGWLYDGVLSSQFIEAAATEIRRSLGSLLPLRDFIAERRSELDPSRLELVESILK